MIIVGAGMAGLIAAHMLRRYEPTVWERQTELPDNHGALLRFRTDAVSEATGIPFRKVHVTKAVKARGRLSRETNLDLHNRYSLKVTGQVRSRSIINLEPGVRYIAPDDFLAQLARGIRIEYGVTLKPEYVTCAPAKIVPLISTIPMPVLMDMVNWPDQPAFPHCEVWSSTVLLPETVDVYQTIYYPGREPYYRASITGRRLIIEYMSHPDVANEDGSPETDVTDVLCDFGLDGGVDPSSIPGPDIKYHKYGKLLPVDEDVRRAFILAMTDQYALYSLGRFATWRQLLLDDIVHDVKVIEGFIAQRSRYTQRLFSHY